MQIKNTPQEEEIERLLTLVRESKAKIIESLRELSLRSEELRKYCRSNSNDMTAALLTYSSAHIRVAKATASGLERTSSVERLVDRASQEVLEQKRFEEEAKLREAKKKGPESIASSEGSSLLIPFELDAIDELFGLSQVNDG